MKIDRIVLYNFGSYEGKTRFDMTSNNEKNIILIGGKNGAGKTTLFTAMRVCLYGYASMGYKSQNSHYTRAINKLINNSAKLIRPTHASVLMGISLNNGQEIDQYELLREWHLEDTLKEHFQVKKNGILLNESGIADFEKFIMSMIPPELFNLYFFDGEKIAYFFLDEGSNVRIKEAFLTLCGYDTFEIMRKNFKRISAGHKKQSSVLNSYIESSEALKLEKAKCDQLETDISRCRDELFDCVAAIESLEKSYHSQGGITEEQWNEKLLLIKEEEKKREHYNALLKKWANEVIPFLIIKAQLEALKNQIEKEHSNVKYKNFFEILDLPDIKKVLGGKEEILRKIALEKMGVAQDDILNFSFEQNSIVLSQINSIFEFDETKIIKCKNAIKKSLQLSEQLREELKNSNITSVKEYMEKRAELFEKKSILTENLADLEQKLMMQKNILLQKEQEHAKIQSKLEEEIKQDSLKDISEKSIFMLDKLQKILYQRQIKKVENLFKMQISALMRKTKFIEDISIDEDFTIHIYRRENMQISSLQNVLLNNSVEKVYGLLGAKAIGELKKITKTEDFDSMIRALDGWDSSTIDLPIEIDKMGLSNGEKQIFIMALYYSLIQLCTHEIPFVIDTPFARIDTEHRRNISKNFFRKLNGQVFILSTNEEINSAHVQILNDKIAATYMLENTDNKKTVVVNNQYFEE